MGTVEADDPSLTVRLSDDDALARSSRTLHRLIIARSRLPRLDSRLMNSIDVAPVHLVVPSSGAAGGTGGDVDPRLSGINHDDLRALERAGATIHPARGDESLVEAAVRLGGALSMTHLIVEGGAATLGLFYDRGLIDQCDVYVGAKMIGGGNAMSPIGGRGAPIMDAATAMQLRETSRFGDDLKLVYRRPPSANDGSASASIHDDEKDFEI